MKNKNLIVGVGVAILLYFIFKSKKGKQVTEQVAEKVKETVKPKQNKFVYKGVEVSGTTSNLGLQFIYITPTIMNKEGFKGYNYSTPQDTLYYVENSKGERRDVVRVKRDGVVINHQIFDGRKNNPFLKTGETFKLYKENLS